MSADNQPRVIVYTTPTCPYCRAAKQYLQQRGIYFEDIDVSSDSQAAMEMVRRTGQQGVPVLDIGGRIVIGFNRPEIDRLLHLK